MHAPPPEEEGSGCRSPRPVGPDVYPALDPAFADSIIIDPVLDPILGWIMVSLSYETMMDLPHLPPPHMPTLLTPTDPHCHHAARRPALLTPPTHPTDPHCHHAARRPALLTPPPPNRSALPSRCLTPCPRASTSPAPSLLPTARPCPGSQPPARPRRAPGPATCPAQAPSTPRGWAWMAGARRTRWPTSTPCSCRRGTQTGSQTL